VTGVTEGSIGQDRDSGDRDRPARDSAAGPDPDESPKERVDRELIELLNGLRVILPGVQVLLAFLLTVPFSSGFEDATSTDRLTYFASVLLTVGATGALTMPAAYHRIRFRQGDKEKMLRLSNTFAIVGLALLTVAMATVVFLITNVLYGVGAAIAVSLVVLVMLGVTWFAVPVFRRIDDTQ
jgi:archaellum biogenesis protein FlaJ (TadC family)